MIHWRYITKELRQTRKQALVFILCSALSISALLILNLLQDSVNSTILGDARRLAGGDIKVHSHYPFSADLNQAIDELEADPDIEVSESVSFYTMVLGEKAPGGFSNIKAVSGNYPLYGEVRLLSGEILSDLLEPGMVVVSNQFQGRYGIGVGERVKIGSRFFNVAGVVVFESTRPADFFILAPRLFMNSGDLASLGLTQKGSRVSYQALVKIAAEQELEGYLQGLKSSAVVGQERVESYKESHSRVKKFFENLFFFLSIISVFILFLAGIGMQSSIGAILRGKEKSIGVIRSLGANTRYIVVNYFIYISILGGVGVFVGVVVSLISQKLMPILFADIIPVQGFGSYSLSTVLIGAGLGMVVILLFTWLPLLRLCQVKPTVIFREELEQVKLSPAHYVSAFLGIMLFGALISFQLDDFKLGLQILLGFAVLIAVMFLLVSLSFYWLGKIKFSSLVFRQAVKSLLRKGNGARSVAVTLSSALTLLMVIFLLQKNLHSTFVQAFPEDAPTLFCIDIQPAQKQAFIELIGKDATLYPVIRARLLVVNGEPVNRQKELDKKSDSLAREFNLSYRDYLLDDTEELVIGETLYEALEMKDTQVPVSILEMVAEMGDIKFGDILNFSIQGLPVEAVVTSVRKRSGSKFTPFFYFVFPSKVLQGAPQTFFAALRVDPKNIAGIQRKLATEMVNVSTINMVGTAKQLGLLVGKLSTIVQIFGSLSLFAGILILISSILATRIERLRETVYYKVLGATAAFVSKVFLYEHLLLGLLSTLGGLFFSQVINWLVCDKILEISVEMFFLESIVLAGGVISLIVLVGHFGVRTVLKEKPVKLLR